MREKILITGSNGLIGSYLVDEAIKNGMAVYSGVRKGSNHESLKSKDTTITYMDFNDRVGLIELLKAHEFDYIIHNAGITKSPDTSQFYEVNVKLLISLCNAIEESGVSLKKFVFISSLAAFGPADDLPNHMVTEDTIPNPVTAYGKSKLEAETFLKSRINLPYIIIRPTAVYGPKDKEFLNVYQMIDNGVNLQPGLDRQFITLIYTKDLAAIIIKAALSEYSKTAYFITDGNLYSSDQFVNVIKKTLKKSTINIRVPLFLVKIITFFTENISRLSGNYSILNTDKVSELEARYWNCDASKFKKELGYEIQYNLEEAIKESVIWYRQNKWL